MSAKSFQYPIHFQITLDKKKIIILEYFSFCLSEMPNKKVCVIGAGPSGMSFMCWAAKFAREGRKVPEVTCFEKQSDWGGLWNYSWRTGTDENGEPVHGSMYR